MQTEQFRETLSNFSAGKHRIEVISEHGGIRYVNDSKATNPHAALAAVRALQENCAGFRLLAGGLDKGMDFSALLEEKSRIRKVYLFGECREKIRRMLEPHIPCADFGSDFEAAILAESGDAFA